MSSAYTATVRQLLDIAPVVFATPHFAIKGGTAIEELQDLKGMATRLRQALLLRLGLNPVPPAH